MQELALARAGSGFALGRAGSLLPRRPSADRGHLRATRSMQRMPSAERAPEALEQYGEGPLQTLTPQGVAVIYAICLRDSLTMHMICSQLAEDDSSACNHAPLGCWTCLRVSGNLLGVHVELGTPQWRSVAASSSMRCLFAAME